jgi:hypothetical protein
MGRCLVRTQAGHPCGASPASRLGRQPAGPDVLVPGSRSASQGGEDVGCCMARCGPRLAPRGAGEGFGRAGVLVDMDPTHPSSERRRRIPHDHGGNRRHTMRPLGGQGADAGARDRGLRETTASEGIGGPAPRDTAADLGRIVRRALAAGVSTRFGARREIAATREIPATRETVFGFLASLENHAALGRGSVELLSLKRGARGANGAVVRLRGPLAIRRTASTAITGTRAPESISGRAWVGPRTRAFVAWQIESAPHGSTVSLRAIVERAGLLDRMLLALGGRWLLERRFASALSCLSHQLALTPAFVSGGDSALLALRLRACGRAHLRTA